MDPIKPVAPTVTPAAVQGVPQAVPTQPQVPANPGGKKTMMILVAVFVVVAILIAAGFYMYMRVSKNNPELTAPDQQSQVELNNLNNEAGSLDLGDVDSDFKDVDSEVSQL